jgi:transmembrane sensor
LATNGKAERELLEEATGWILRLEDAPQGSAVFDEFRTWLASCDEHRAAWERVNKTWTVLGRVKPAYNQKVWGEVVAPRSKPLPPRAAPPHLAGRALAARKSYRRPVATFVAALAAAWLLWVSVPGILVAMRADYRTAAGQIQRVQIADGSMIDLGGSSAIKTDIGQDQRRVMLLAGEAFFDVVTDPERPFIVEVQGVEVKVHGTAFDVQVSSATTKVALLRGSVEATPATNSEAPDILKPGQMFVVDHATGNVSIEQVSLDDIGAWRDGKVFLANTTVGSVVELIQRYSSATILIPDRNLASRKVSGLFDLRNPDRALAGLVEPFGGKVRSVTPFLRVISRL